MPRGMRLPGESQHIAHRNFVLVPLAPVAPVLGVDLVPFVFGLLADPESAQLLLLADVQPKFDHDRAVLDELMLKHVEFAVSPSPFIFPRKPFQPLDQHAAIP